MMRNSLTTAVAILAISAPSLAGASPSRLSPTPVPESPAAQLQSVGSEDVNMASVLGDDAGLHPAILRALPATTELLGASGQRVNELIQGLRAATQRRTWAETEIPIRTQSLAQAREREAEATQKLQSATSLRQQSQADLTVFGVDAFINGSDQTDVFGLLQATNDNAASVATSSLRSTQLYQAAGLELGATLKERQEVERQRTVQLSDAEAITGREQVLLAKADSTLSEATASIATLTPQLKQARAEFERDLLLRTVPGTNDLKIVAVNAHVTASEIAAKRWPACGITWNQLAGVGRVESFNGLFGSSTIDRRGNTSPRILGPQLNGDPWLAIPDTDGGRLDGDLEWDRAVGPMQFIPTSWAIFSADGNGDGREDPHNLYDAALAAGDHLCGSGLDSEDGFRRALLGYNRSVQYGSDVIRFSDLYASLLPIDLSEPSAPTAVTDTETED